MRKTLSILVLALGLIFTVVPAQADDHPTTPPCLDDQGNPAPCPGSVCIDHFGHVTPCDPCAFAIEVATDPLHILITDLRAAIVRRNARIERQRARIARQHATIARLRHRLHAH